MYKILFFCFLKVIIVDFVFGLYFKSFIDLLLFFRRFLKKNSKVFLEVLFGILVIFIMVVFIK